MSDSGVPSIESFGILLIQALNSAREADLRRFHEKVVVIRHEHPRMQDPATVLYVSRKDPQESLGTVVVTINVAAFVPTAGDVPDHTGKLEKQLAGQGRAAERNLKQGSTAGLSGGSDYHDARDVKLIFQM